MYLINSPGRTKGTDHRLGCCVAVTNSKVQQTARYKMLHGFYGVKFALRQKLLG